MKKFHVKKSALSRRLSKCETVYERVINVVTLAYWMRSEDYYIKLHFLKVLNYKIL